MSDLFSPIRVGELQLDNRIIMAPLTRCRAIHERVPNELMAEYYVQRASAGMILTEATSISSMAVGYPNTPGIWNEPQTEGWRKITDAVHDAGGKILLQLWHVGRISDPHYLSGAQPLAPSAIAPQGHVSLLRPMKDFEIPKAMSLNEIQSTIEDYRQGAVNAKAAGFDGVEIHGANGYLLDQFLQTSSNQRTDEYGGSIENRARLMLEVADAVADVWGAGRVGMHLAPRCDAHSMGDHNPAETFGYVADELSKRNLAFICTREHVAKDSLTPMLKERFKGVVIANENIDYDSANQLLTDGRADAVAFGRSFISNPDLVERFKRGASLAKADSATFYGDGPEGYTDYPRLEAVS